MLAISQTEVSHRFRRLREEAPLYFNEEHGFRAISRYAEVERALKDKESFSSAWRDPRDTLTEDLDESSFVCRALKSSP
jgi:cytochrome P450